MDNEEHYQQFLDYLNIAESVEGDIKEILLKTAKALATQNYVICNLLEKLLKK